MQHYGSLLNDQVNGTHHYASASLNMRKHLTVRIGESDGTLFDTVEYLRSLTPYGIHTVDYTEKQ